MDNAVTVQEHQPVATTSPMQQLTVNEILSRRQLVQQVTREVMQENVHFGKIPGTDSMALLKPGAEMLGMTFGLRATFDVRPTELPNSHREYLVECMLTAADGSVVATASGLCTTMESKYRWRTGKQKCPQCGALAIFKAKDRDEFYCWWKKDGCGATFKGDDRRIASQSIGKIENPDIADTYNTVMKMAAKRAHVAVIRLALAVSDMFEVDEEEQPADEPRRDERPPEQTEQQKLAQECGRLASELGREPDSIRELLHANGLKRFKSKWSDLTQADLAKAKKVLEEEVQLTKGGK